MKKTKIKIKIRIKVKEALLILFVSFFLLEPITASYDDNAFAEQLSSEFAPYTKIFTISAYYSPLPCQNKYATGSYEGDIRLNGYGMHGADGTEVYPGMIAAPKDYQFGTKMHIPGLGIVAVHDRGGAIRSYNGIEGVYDRLDVWMGYGDKGLKRALNWGKRTIDTVVYGVNDSIEEQIDLEDYSSEESIANSCDMPVKGDEPQGFANISQESVNIVNFDANSEIDADLKLGDSGQTVIQLQKELKKLNFLNIEPTGYFGEVTEHAVYKFQQSQKLVWDESSLGAGLFGPKTRDRLNEIIAARNYTTIVIAQATSAKKDALIAAEEKAFKAAQIVSLELQFGVTHPEVSTLQKFLKDKGYFNSGLITQYFGPATKDAVLKFQIDNGIVTAESDNGAGRVGPETLKLINSFS